MGVDYVIYEKTDPVVDDDAYMVSFLMSIGMWTAFCHYGYVRRQVYRKSR